MLELPMLVFPPRPPNAAAEDVAAHEWARAQATLEMARATQQPWHWCEGLQALARCQRDSGDADAAQASLARALAWAPLLGAADLWAELLCERAELAAATLVDAQSPASDAELEDWLLARSCASDAAALAGRSSDATREVAVLLRASALFKRLGQPAHAVALQARAMNRLARPDDSAADAPLPAAAPPPPSRE